MRFGTGKPSAWSLRMRLLGSWLLLPALCRSA
jgi:hypothetical protein